MGFAEEPGLIRKWKDYTATTSRHIVRQALETIKVHAVFGFSTRRTEQPGNFTPVLYFAHAQNDAGASAIHRLVWSQGVVPILLIATPSALQIRKSLTPPTTPPISIPWEKLDEKSELPVELSSLTALAVKSSVVWNDYAIDRSGRVDSTLLTAIKELNQEVQEKFDQLKSDAALINAIIGRFIYFFVLLDRGIVSAEWAASLVDETGRKLCPVISQMLADSKVSTSDKQWPAREIWTLFDRIDDVLNGAIFPITSSQRKRIPVEALHLVRRSIRYGDRLNKGTRQLGFLDISFATLRTETISAIYELFLFIEAPTEKEEAGAFYTPPFLVDYVLDQVDRIKPFGQKSRVLDPAAGSGIFLVGAFRRIIERALPKGRWHEKHFQTARRLLTDSIFGIERNSQAANVARFSLYLTLLDYVDDQSIDELRTLVRGVRVFPSLEHNVLDRDVFLVEERDVGRFSHVVGNPPWGSFGVRSARDRTNVPRDGRQAGQQRSDFDPALAFYEGLDPAEYPVTNKRLSELFMWKIQRDLMAPKGALGVLISTRSYVARTATAFPNALAKRLKVVGLANLSHFRYRLFKGARSPTIAIFAQSIEPEDSDAIWIYSPLLTSQPIGEKGHLWSIVVSDLDIEHYKRRDLMRTDAWFVALMLRPLDRGVANYARLWTQRMGMSFGSFLSSSGLGMARGGSPAQTGLSSELLLGATDYRQRLGLDGLEMGDYPHSKLKRTRIEPAFERLFSGNVIIIPRTMNDVIFIKDPIAFGSSFNAIYSLDDQPFSSQREQALKSVARFLRSDVARYFYALIGKTWMLDHARLEKNDLESIPFPFASYTDQNLHDLLSADERSVTEMVAKLMRLDSTFINAVEEYASFRNGYEDSQVPNAGLSPPDGGSVKQYQQALTAELMLQFGKDAVIRQSFLGPGDANRFAYIDVVIGRSPAKRDRSQRIVPEARPSPQGFNPRADFQFTPADSSVAVSKPWTRVAWTLEQAYADAHAIAEEVLRHGRSD